MQSRREFIGTGLSAFFIGLLNRSALARQAAGPGATHGAPISSASPGSPVNLVEDMPESVMIDGFPFAPFFLGDDFPKASAIPFHSAEDEFPGGKPPAPTEEVDVAIIGGGMSGLSTAYFLRDYYPVIFELHERFGGVSGGESWSGIRYSKGGAYFITPDKGSFLESLYQELGLDQVYRYSAGGMDPMELNNVILKDFWNGLSDDDARAFQRYAEIVAYYADEAYPDIPLDPKKDNQWIIDLDQLTFKQDLEQRMGMPIPPLLAAGIQSYFYSSFDSSWETVSAASGWNFIAAEEFGRWVCPGGNNWVIDQFYKRILRAYKHGPDGADVTDRLRPNHRAVDVRVQDDGRVLISYKTPGGEFRSLLARRCVVACSKHIAKHFIHDLQNLDLDKSIAMSSVQTNPYVVANVLLTEPIKNDFYDTFLLGDGNFPMTEPEAANEYPVTDMITGDFAGYNAHPRNVLTLYWPLPVPSMVFLLIDDDAYMNFAHRLVPQLQRILDILGLPAGAVRQIRMTRWGHAMPIASPGLLALDVPNRIRRPFMGSVYFVNQDNWLLPAFETCLLEAKTFSDQIRADLKS
ncbi:MAG TPA: NAD(P)-binding protein [Phycisphaerales bacterium]|nr:NAD(P)-binding protein [Phycisphaerales bacterium]